MPAYDLRPGREYDLVRVLRALEQAQQFIRERPKEAQAILLEWLKLDQGFVDWAWKDLDFGDYVRDLVSGLMGSFSAQAAHVEIDLQTASILLNVDRRFRVA